MFGKGTNKKWTNKFWLLGVGLGEPKGFPLIENINKKQSEILFFLEKDELL